MTKIEILEMTNTEVRAAFYYDVTPLPAAVDQGRTPAGSSLQAAQIQDLKDGKVFEYIFTGRPRPNLNLIKNKLVERYTAMQPRVQMIYRKLYDGDGLYYDGSSWNNASP